MGYPPLGVAYAEEPSRYLKSNSFLWGRGIREGISLMKEFEGFFKKMKA